MAKARPASELPRSLAAFERWHADRPERWEYIFGTTVLMAPPSRTHTLIKTRLGRHLGNRLAGGPCTVYVDGVEVKARDLSAIPDLVVECREPDLASPVVAEPVLIVEIVSPSSERDDSHRKWQGYCLIPSLRHYMIVAQARPFVILHTRTGPFSWHEQMFLDGTIELDAFGIKIGLDEIYDGITFAEEPADG